MYLQVRVKVTVNRYLKQLNITIGTYKDKEL